MLGRFFALKKSEQLVAQVRRWYSVSSLPSSTPMDPSDIGYVTENNAAHSYLKSKPEYKETFYDPTPLASLETWREFKPILTEFRDYSQTRQGGTDVEPETLKSITTQQSTFRDEELKALLYLTGTMTFPKKRGTFPNYERLWKSLDAECMSRTLNWNYSEVFVVGDLWFLNRLYHSTDFHWYLIKKMFRKCDKLNKVEFMRFLFCLNLIRQIPKAINTYELEHCLNQHVQSLTASEVCIAAMAMFKTQTPVRDFELFTKLFEMGMSEASTLDPIFIAALCKLGRLSGKGKTAAILYSFQEALVPEIERLSITSAMHLAIIGTRTQVFHEELLAKVLRKMEKEIERMRVKDMERLLLVFTTFDIDCEEFCRNVVEELRSPKRVKELEEHGKVLPSILFYVSMKQVYPYDLINTALSTEFLSRHFGRNLMKYLREIACLDFSVELDCGDYKGNRLDPKIRKSIARRNLIWLWPESHEKVSAYERSVRTAAKHVRRILRNNDYVYVCNILPQFHTAELVFFLDESNRAVKIPENFTAIPNEEPKIIPTDLAGMIPHAVLVCSYNSVIRNRSNALLGQVKLQVQQLQKMGYKVHVVYPDEVAVEQNETPERFEARDEFFRKLIFGESVGHVVGGDGTPPRSHSNAIVASN